MSDLRNEDFKKAILRIPRRQYIQEELESGNLNNIFESRKKTRDRESLENINSRLDLLLEPYSTIEPKVRKIVEGTFAELQEKFPSVAAIIIIGSGGHGGGIIRTISGRDVGDLDWGVVFNDSVPPNDVILRIKEYYSALIYDRSEEFGFDEHLHSCPAMNPASLGPSITKLTYDQADLIIQKPEIAFIAKYFHPTIPREVGLNNRLLILQALRKLEREDRSAFLHLLKKLEANWRIDHSLQGKHFRNFKDLPKTDELVDKAVELSQTHMASPFEELNGLMSA